jgi:hypothetical protein
MHIPFVIDNQQHKMVDVLNTLLHHYKGQSLDVATAYFNVGGWQLLCDGLNGLGNFRLLLGDEPEAGFDLGLREVGAKPVKGLIRDLAKETFNEKTLRQVEDLVAFLRQDNVQVRLYTPYQVYMKAIFEYFRDDLENGAESTASVRSAVELSEFQEDAVKKARKILASYDGVMVADSVGLGKTWIGKKLLEDYAYHRRYKAVVICPASLQKMWRDELMSAGIAVRIVTQEALGRDEFDISEVQDADIILVDDSHNFRNRNAQRYENLERILAANNRRGKASGERKKLILLTAIPNQQ